MSWILLVEDDPLIAEFTQTNLEMDGFDVEAVSSGAAALDLLRRRRPDAIVLDIMLPDMDGFEMCRRLRKRSLVLPEAAQTPVIMLTARAEDVDKLEGFDAGADDYLTKPFNPPELTARIKAVLRRTQGKPGGGVVQIRELVINPQNHSVHLNGEPMSLSPKEFDLLHLLASHVGQVFSREELLEQVWEYSGGNTRTVDEHIKRLRRKLETHPDYAGMIVTYWAVGYKLEG